jgi:hypothetical protein
MHRICRRSLAASRRVVILGCSKAAVRGAFVRKRIAVEGAVTPSAFAVRVASAGSPGVSRGRCPARWRFPVRSPHGKGWRRRDRPPSGAPPAVELAPPELRSSTATSGGTVPGPRMRRLHTVRCLCGARNEHRHEWRRAIWPPEGPSSTGAGRSRGLCSPQADGLEQVWLASEDILPTEVSSSSHRCGS